MLYLHSLVFLSYVLVPTALLHASLGDRAHAGTANHSSPDSRYHQFIYTPSLKQPQVGQENSTSNNLEEIYIGLLLPFNFNDSRSHYKGAAMYYAEAFPLALKSVNDNPYLLPGYKLIYSWNNTKCKDLYSTLAMYGQFRSRDRKGLPVHGFIGLGCECESAAKFASAMQVPLVSHMCSSPALSNKKEFPTFSRTYPLAKFVLPSLRVLLRTFNWSTVAVISSTGSNTYQEAGDAMLEMLKKSFKISYKTSVPSEATYNKTDEIFKDIMADIKKKARIVIFFCEYSVAKEGLVYAKRSGMGNGSYVFILVHLDAMSLRDKLDLPFKWFYTLHSDEKTRNHVEEMFKHTLVLGYKVAHSENMEEYENYTRELKKANNGPPFYNYKYNTSKDFRTKVPLENIYLYDAVQVMALAMNKTLNQNKSVTDGMAIVENIKGLTYQSIHGNEVTINEDGDAHGYFTLFGHDYRRKEKGGKREIYFRPVGEFEMKNKTGHSDLVYKPINPIKWAAGVLPLDHPKCGFKGELCPKVEREKKSNFQTILAVSVSVTVIGVILLLLPIFKYRQYRLERELTSKLWKVSLADLAFVNEYSSPSRESSPLTSHTSTSSEYSENCILSVTINDDCDTHPFESRTVVAIFKGTYVAVKEIRRRPVELSREVLLELKQMRDIHHDNINQFIGAAIESDRTYIVTQYALRGSLKDVLEDSSIKLELHFLLSLIYDIVKGMNYLHMSEMKSHGNLKSSNCVIDSRWVLKITDFGLHRFKGKLEKRHVHENWHSLLWRAPELLRTSSPPARGTEKGDLYSFGIILQECHTRKGPYSAARLSLTDQEIVMRVKDGELPPFRPTVSEIMDDAASLRDLMKRCLLENPEIRPSFHIILREIEAMMKASGMKRNIVDNMVYMMERYTDHLEDLVEQRTGELLNEKKKIEALLERMLPASVAKQLKQGKEVEAEEFKHVSIYFSDIVGFTELCAESNPMQVVRLLNDLYTLFDNIIKGYDVYKVETIGDAYMVVSGLPIRNEREHGSEIALMALHITDAIQTFKIHHRADRALQLRIGINSGSVVAGVVGTTMPRYCLFGDTVNTASRMESTGAASKIHISESTKLALDAVGGFQTESRGPTFVKGKGEIDTFWLIDVHEVHKRRISKHEQNMRCHNARIGSTFPLTMFKETPEEQSKLSGGIHSNGVMRTTPDVSPMVLKKAFVKNHKESKAIPVNEDNLPLLNQCGGDTNDIGML